MKLTNLRRKVAATAAVGALALATACGADTGAEDTVNESTNGTTSVVATSYTDLDDTHADSNDDEYSTDGATTINLADGASEVDGAAGAGASVDGDVVNITAAGTYLISGELSDGQIVVNSTGDGKVNLVLDGIDITSTDNSPIVFTEADEAVVILADGSTNNLSDGAGSAADDEVEDAPTATLYSMADLTIGGTGTLNVNGVSNDGIGSKDGLVVLRGTVNVDATDDGVRGKDYAVFAGGTLDIAAGGDGIKADNDTDGEFGVVQIIDGTITISAQDDGADAVGVVEVSGGKLDVTESLEGLEARQINISGGTNAINASDDGINPTVGAELGTFDTQDGVNLNLTGGTTTVRAESGDALDSNGTAEINGGTMILISPSAGGRGTGAVDTNGDFTINGGNLVTIGTNTTEPLGEQSFAQTTLSTPAEPGQLIALVNSDDTVLASYVATETSSTVLFSTAGVTAGEQYTFFVGDAGDASGFTNGGSVDGLSEAGSATAGQTDAGVGGGGWGR